MRRLIPCGLLVCVAFNALPAQQRELIPSVAHFDLNRGSLQALRDSLEAAELRFFSEWTDAYKLSEGYGAKLYPVHWTMANCTSWPDRAGARADSSKWKGRIKSEFSAFAVCPSWILGDSATHDERLDRDVALAPRFRTVVRDARRSLIAVFAAAARLHPTDAWISGQLVRLLVDQREFDQARAAALSCRASEARCWLLSGYVHAERGEIREADQAFASALSRMSGAERCKWTDARMLLEQEAQEAYRVIPCERRSNVDAKLWWLADPMWTEPANERRVEHLMRQVAIALRMDVRRDERWDWRVVQGGDALAEMVIRYGWPSTTQWWGLAYDRAQTGRYLVPSRRGAANPPYTTFEYSPERLQTIPAWRAVQTPFRSTSDDWFLRSADTRPLHDTQHDSVDARFGFAGEEDDAVRRVNLWWWPQNHFLPRVPISQIADGELAFLRREVSAIVAMVIEPDSSLLSRGTDTPINATLVVTAQPDSYQFPARARRAAGKPIVLYGPVEARPSLIGVEVIDSTPGNVWAGRTRYGVAPPAPLASMKAGDAALSDLLLLDAPADGSELPVAPNDVLPRSRSSVLPAGTTRLGLYWETYGIEPSDSIEIAVWIERSTPQGIFRRFGIALNVAKDLNTPVAMSWSERGNSGGRHIIPGRIPVVGRSVSVDVATLPPGDYQLEVAVRKSGQEPVRVRRTLQLRER